MPTNRLLSLAGVTLLVVIVFAMRGCDRYGKINELSFAHAKALYAACNSREPERLQACATLVAEAESSQQISKTEARYLRDIIAAGQAERWTDAQAMARQLMTDQAGR